MTEGRHVPLEKACIVEYGTRVVQKRDGGSVYPVYGGGGATFSMDVFNRQDRLVVSRFGMSEECTRFVSGKFFLNDSGLTVSSNDAGLDQRFLDYQIHSLNDQIFSLGKGSAQKNLDVPAFRELPIFIPDTLVDQQRIVGILDKAFEGIATAKANAEVAFQSSRDVFEAVLQSAFATKKDGWTEEPLASFCDVRHGYAFDGDDFSADVSVGAPIVITPGNFTEKSSLSFTQRNTKRFSGVVPEGYQFSVGDLVVVMTDLSSKMKILGKPAFIDRENILHNQRIGRVVFIGNKVNPRLLYYFMQTDTYLRSIRETATGTMVRHTAPKRILSNLMPFPIDLTEQAAIVSRLDEVAAETSRLESLFQQKLGSLADLRKSLLHHAFSGQL